MPSRILTSSYRRHRRRARRRPPADVSPSLPGSPNPGGSRPREQWREPPPVAADRSYFSSAVFPSFHTRSPTDFLPTVFRLRRHPFHCRVCARGGRICTLHSREPALRVRRHSPCGFSASFNRLALRGNASDRYRDIRTSCLRWRQLCGRGSSRWHARQVISSPTSLRPLPPRPLYSMRLRAPLPPPCIIRPSSNRHTHA